MATFAEVPNLTKFIKEKVRKKLETQYSVLRDVYLRENNKFNIKKSFFLLNSKYFSIHPRICSPSDRNANAPLVKIIKFSRKYVIYCLIASIDPFILEIWNSP